MSTNSRNQHSFLSNLLDSFGQIGGKDPSGRILSQCYAHAMEVDPTLFDAILGVPVTKLTHTKVDPRKLELKTEDFRLDGHDARRRADICILYNSRRRALVEVKVEDQKDDDPTGQLDSYVQFALKQRVPFFYITKYSLSRDEIQLLGKLPKNLRFHRRHHEIENALRLRPANEIAQMISRYLEDRQMAGYQPMDITREDLTNFARRMLPVAQSGYGKRLHAEQRTSKIGQIITQCLNNSRIVGEWLRYTHEAEFTFSVYPSVETYWKIPKLLEYFNAHPDEVNDGEIGRSFSDGGCFEFIVDGRFTNIGYKQPLSLWVSLWIELYRARKEPLEVGLWVGYLGGSLKSPEEDDQQYNKWGPYAERSWSLQKSEVDTRKALSKMIVEAQRKLVKLRKHPDKKLHTFARAKQIQRIASMKFPGLVP